MMKKCIMGLLLMVLVVSLVGCGKLSVRQSRDNNKKQTENRSQDNKKDQLNKEEVKDRKKEETKDINQTGNNEIIEENPKSQTVIVVYSCNDDATAFSVEEVSIDSLSYQEIINALVAKNVVTSDVQILKFNINNINGKKSIEIDFNLAFDDYICTMGSTGEYYTIGSICNTFLKNYNCEQIQITVEGNVLSTGHADYSGYMTEFF